MQAQEELIEAHTAMEWLECDKTAFYRMVKRRGIKRVIPPGKTRRGLYKKQDIRDIIHERENFNQQYRVVR